MRAALVAVAVVAVLVPAAAGAKTDRAALTIVSKSPLRVAGHGFRGREHVRVSLQGAGAASARRVTASAQGAFTVTWRTVTVGGACRSVVIRAVGSDGSTALTKLIPAGCAPAPGG
jgi:hypothetical protein